MDAGVWFCIEIRFSAGVAFCTGVGFLAGFPTGTGFCIISKAGWHCPLQSRYAPPVQKTK
ncbi:22842_t:CDS:2 [Dentiscutata erythropus]|uniref:22842_t:CDS:1 n=1 Tax=Dentiscutata erythropus TaxID=1348616 RepID=A0A9N9N864_9GLOM|nr:22842_t:CDS:2 [Dentiscutata erythropus]